MESSSSRTSLDSESSSFAIQEVAREDGSASFSSLSLHTNPNRSKDLVEEVLQGDFENVEKLLDKLTKEGSSADVEQLADRLVDLVEDKDMGPLMRWTTDLAASGTLDYDCKYKGENGFPRTVRTRTIFGQEGVESFRRLIVPYYRRVQKEAENIQMDTVEGKTIICDIMNDLIHSYAVSVERSPIFNRQILSHVSKTAPASTGPLHTCVTRMMDLNRLLILNPFVLKFTDEQPTEKEMVIMKECARLWAQIKDQADEVEEPYKSFVKNYNDILNAFIAKYIDDEAIQKAMDLKLSKVGTDERKEKRTKKNFEDFLESLDVDTTTISTLDRFPDDDEQTSEDQRAMLLEKLRGTEKWKMVKEEGEIKYYKLLNDRNENDKSTICARVDARIPAQLQHFSSFLVEESFSEDGGQFSNITSTMHSEHCRQISYNHVFPWPFTTRFMSLRASVLSSENDSLVYFNDFPSGEPRKRVCGSFLPSGAWIRRTANPNYLDVSYVIHFDPKGNVPKWAAKSLRSSLMKKMSATLKAQRWNV